MEHIAEGDDPKYNSWYTNNLALVKLWTTFKKIKPRITQKAAIYFDIVGLLPFYFHIYDENSNFQIR